MKKMIRSTTLRVPAIDSNQSTRYLHRFIHSQHHQQAHQPRKPLSFLPSNRALELRMSIDHRPSSSPKPKPKPSSSSNPPSAQHPTHPESIAHPSTSAASHPDRRRDPLLHPDHHEPVDRIRGTPERPPARNSIRREENFWIRCIQIDSSGRILGSRSMSKGEICAKNRLQPRDLRKIDSRISNVVPSILVRDEAIIFNVLNIRALIKADSILIFEDPNSPSLISAQPDHHPSQNPSPSPSSLRERRSGSSQAWEVSSKTSKSHATHYSIRSAFLHNLLNNLRDQPPPPTTTSNQPHHRSSEDGQAPELPYEFRALETMLGSVATSLESELGVLKTLVSSLLDGLEQNIEREKLKQLLLYSRRLSTFNGRALLVQRCLDEILENEQDMANAYLTQKKLKREPREVDDHEELEQLLESFSKYVEEILHEGTSTLTNIKSTEEIIDLILDSNRNTLLALDLKVSIATMGLGMGAFTAGLFGMNLTSHFEHHRHAFYIVSGLTITTVGLSIAYGCRRLYRLRRVGLSSLMHPDHHPSSSRRIGYHHWSTSSDPRSPCNPCGGGGGGILDWDVPPRNSLSLISRIKNRIGIGCSRSR